ncbi:hypothetical protein ACFWDI_26015 [Streptomyces sp. NPDC060064]|uniref:hypothetical protein n=1 Tax=Streptomyces sp. NPDC060064 TaxID=3347049 RepID=UPI0036806CEE
MVIVEHRADNSIAVQLLELTNVPAAQRPLRIELGVLGALGGGCRTACSAHAAYDDAGTQVHVIASVFAPEGGTAVNVKFAQPAGGDQAVVDKVAQSLRDGGAGTLLPPG